MEKLTLEEFNFISGLVIGGAGALAILCLYLGGLPDYVWAVLVAEVVVAAAFIALNS